MKQALTLTKNSNQQHGFTLVETAIAMGMVAVMISGFMIAFGPAVQGINKSISVKDASRLSSALELEMSVLRAGEVDTVPDDGDKLYVTAFEKAYNWIKGSSTKATIVLIYQYRGNPASVRTDGTLNPYTGTGTIPGEDYVIQTSVRLLSDSTKVSAELAPRVLEGRVYYVKMKQLIYDSGEMVVTGSPSAILDPQTPYAATTYANYPEAVIAYQAEFYALPNVLYSYINTTFTPANAGNPVFTRNMAVSR